MARTGQNSKGERFFFGVKKLAKLAIRTQDLQRWQQSRLNPHGPAGIRRSRDVADREMPALPAIGAALRGVVL